MPHADASKTDTTADTTEEEKSGNLFPGHHDTELVERRNQDQVDRYNETAAEQAGAEDKDRHWYIDNDQFRLVGAPDDSVIKRDTLKGLQGDFRTLAHKVVDLCPNGGAAVSSINNLEASFRLIVDEVRLHPEKAANYKEGKR